jgi:hypothetical protein
VHSQRIRVAITATLTAAARPSRVAAEWPLIPLRIGWSCRPTRMNRIALTNNTRTSQKENPSSRVGAEAISGLRQPT